MYITPKVGTVLPAMENTEVKNPGPVQVESGDGLNEWLQAQAQHTAWRQNKVLKEEYKARVDDSPEYASRLGRALSWGVVVLRAEAGGVDFDLQRVGVSVSNL